VKFILVLLFILVSIPFFYIGKYLITSDYQKYIIEGTKTSNGNKLYLNRVKAKAELVNQFIEKNNRYPSRKEISCDFKECKESFPLFWDIVELSDNNFIISYNSPGIMFTSAQSFKLFYNTKTNSSSYDHLLEPWQLKIWFFFNAIGDLCIMWFPLVFWIFCPIFFTVKKNLTSKLIRTKNSWLLLLRR
jgi:hypothetical protein